MNSHRRLLVAIVAFLALAPIAAAYGQNTDNERPFTFALWGDTPYTPDEVAKMPALIADVNDSKVKFSIFVGDIKSGSTLCTNDVFTDAANRFNAFEAPMIYVPGDNEWTDCHRKNNGGYNNLERLAYIRATMFATAESFGERKFTLEHQGALGGPYSENTRWSYNDIVFVGLNVPGSNNNKVNGADCFTKSVRTAADCAADNAEYAERNAKNNAFISESFALAKSRHAIAILIAIQADPSFDLPETENANERTCIRATTGYCLNTTDKTLAGYDGYDDMIATLVSETQNFAGQVVLVHGDTHFFRVDKPLIDQAHLLPNFTRVQAFGSPNAQWILATVDRKSRNIFSFEPMIVGTGSKKN